MVKTLEATWDGEKILPDEPLNLEPNTRLRVTIEDTEIGLPKKDATISFLRLARSAKVQGPPDWATNIEDYLDQNALDDHDEADPSSDT